MILPDELVGVAADLCAARDKVWLLVAIASCTGSCSGGRTGARRTQMRPVVRKTDIEFLVGRYVRPSGGGCTNATRSASMTGGPAQVFDDDEGH
jgi:hypothetical protein